MEGFELLFYFDLDDDGIVRLPVCSADDVGSAFGGAPAQFLGAGSFGETWLLPPLATGEPARAVKIIVNPLYPARRLDAEVAGLQRVSHPNVVRLLDRVTVPLRIGGRVGLVFEYVPGGDLSARLAAKTTDVAEVRAFASALLAAIESMHAAGTVHRDIKPQNIALRGGDIGDPVLLDLGLAKLLDAETMTLYPAPMGTCPFMAPEQVRGERAGKQADVWALGIVLHLMLTGRHPFFGPRSEAMSSDEALVAYAAGPPPLPASVPLDLAIAVTAMLKFEPFERGSARRHRRALDAQVGGTRGTL